MRHEDKTCKTVHQKTEDPFTAKGVQKRGENMKGD